MQPTPEQIERLKVWLDTRLHAIFRGDPFPRLPISIEEDLKVGVDFSAIFQEYGFSADGLGVLPNFHEIQQKTKRGVKA